MHGKHVTIFPIPRMFIIINAALSRAPVRAIAENVILHTLCVPWVIDESGSGRAVIYLSEAERAGTNVNTIAHFCGI